MSKKGIVVVGSYNVGLFLKSDRLPQKGETIIGHTFHEGGGGKGSNQAVAASFLGSKVTFIGRLGKDVYGENALAMYDRYGIGKDYIYIDDHVHTGISVILIDNTGANLISVVPGANYNLSTDDIDKAGEIINNSLIAGFQLESNFDVVEYGITKCHSMGVQTLLDPAPAMILPDSIFPNITYIKPNMQEASIITGIEVTDVPSAVEAGKRLLNRGVKIVIVTMGEQGSVLIDSRGYERFPSMQVNAVDTTGAGDCFSGGFMTALDRGFSIADSIRFANCAAGLSVTKIGVIESLPSLEEVNTELGNQGLKELIL